MLSKILLCITYLFTFYVTFLMTLVFYLGKCWSLFIFHHLPQKALIRIGEVYNIRITYFLQYKIDEIFLWIRLSIALCRICPQGRSFVDVPYIFEQFVPIPIWSVFYHAYFMLQMFIAFFYNVATWLRMWGCCGL